MHLPSFILWCLQFCHLIFLFSVKEQVLFFFSLVFLLIYFVAVLGFSLLQGLHIGVASLVADHRLKGVRTWVVMAWGLIFLDQWSNPCPLCWGWILNHWATREAQRVVSSRQHLGIKRLTQVLIETEFLAKWLYILRLLYSDTKCVCSTRDLPSQSWATLFSLHTVDIWAG